MASVALGELDRVKLPDGTVGTILMVFGDGKAYLVEYPTPGGEHLYAQDFFDAGEVEATDERMANPYEGTIWDESAVPSSLVKPACPPGNPAVWGTGA